MKKKKKSPAKGGSDDDEEEDVPEVGSIDDGSLRLRWLPGS